MPVASNYQNVFRINKPDTLHNGHGVQSHATKARRNRQPLSCDACRVRKLKCDRQVPCTPCTKRGETSSASCSYAKASKDGGNSSQRASICVRSEAQLRLQKLEDMVTGLMQTTSAKENGSSSVSSADVDRRMKDLSVSLQSSPPTSEPVSSGHLDKNGLERNYQGATHWTTILDNIHDIQGFLDSNEQTSPETPNTEPPEAPDIIFETMQPLLPNDVLSFLPPRGVVDRLVSVYFSSKYFWAPFIHSRKFLREYQAFWTDPLSTSLLWISILFSVLWNGLRVEAVESNRPSPDNTYLIRAAQALVAGGYQKGRPHSVEATLLYALCIFYQAGEDPTKDAWMTMGLACRLALKMGYHRDPSHLANITPFEGEIRRRCFFLLDTFDSLLAIQHGLPAIIHEEDCDTEPPRNLLEEDLNEDCDILPPSRPSTTATPILYFVFKSRFVKAHKRAIRLALTLRSTSYVETMRLDADLHQNDADTPPSLRLGSLNELLLDAPYQIIRRMHIKFQYLTSLCVLHRKYLNYERTNAEFEYSRTTCTSAAMQLLKHQADINSASQPGGRFHKYTPMTSFLPRYHFLLAAMLICLDLYESHSKRLLSTSEDLKAQAKKYDALRLSNQIWTSGRENSREAERASRILAVMLSRVPRPDVKEKPSLDTLINHPAMPQFIGSDSGSSLEQRSVGGFTWYANMHLTSNPNSTPDDYATLTLDVTDPLNVIFDGTEDIDWVSQPQALQSLSPED